ncbi:MAG: Trk system potassium transporter TrkA [Chlamydiae bacterium]|nr:Trk system potassium transporter TrkA [Chlamydiota bacterium]
MNIVILGAGKTGTFVASILSQAEHSVVLIDKEGSNLEKVERELDIASVHCNAPNYKLFVDLMSQRPDVFFAATGNDETNLVCCAIAKKIGFPKTIARVKSSEYIDSTNIDLNRLFCVDHFIGAELLAAQDLFKVLVHTGDIALEHFANGAIHMKTILIPSSWNQEAVCIQDLQLPEYLIVALIHRSEGETALDIIPHGDDQIRPGDEVTLIGEAKVMDQLHRLFQIEEKRVRSVILAGGSSIARHLASFLLRQRIQVRIIESDPIRCNELADLLPQATIINRDAKDSSLLTAERVKDADALVACVEDEETNFLVAALGQKLGCSKSIALISDPMLAPLLEKLDVTPALSARANLTNKVLSIVHEEAILSIASLVHSEHKIVELKVGPNAKVIGIPLAKLHLPKNLLIAVIERHGEVSIGRGNSLLAAHDIVVVICRSEHLNQLQQLFHSC